MREFKPDGCTSAPDLFWKACCDEHDYHYQTGDISRAEADKRFLRCMQSDAKSIFGRYVVSVSYYLAVRIFGKQHYARDGSKLSGATGESGDNSRSATLRGEDGAPPN